MEEKYVRFAPVDDIGPFESSPISIIEKPDEFNPLNLMWLGVFAGIIVWQNLHAVHGSLIAGIVAGVVAAVVAAGFFGIAVLLLRFGYFGFEQVFFYKEGILVKKTSGLKTWEYWQVPWQLIVQLDLRKSVNILYEGKLFNKLEFIKSQKKKWLEGCIRRFIAVPTSRGHLAVGTHHPAVAASREHHQRKRTTRLLSK